MNVTISRQHLSIFARMLAVTLIYAFLGILVGDFSGSNFANIIYPSSGIGLAAVLLGGNKYALSVYFGAMLINVFSQSPIGLTLILPLASTLESLFAVWLLTHYGYSLRAINSFKDFFRLTGIVGAISSSIAALMGSTMLLLAGSITGNAYLTTFRDWWMGDMLGIILVTPIILVWRTLPMGWLKPARLFEFSLLITLTFFAGQIIFMDWFQSILAPVTYDYWLFLFITWSAIRFGLHGTVMVLLIVTVQALIGSSRGLGFLSHDFSKTHLTNLWFFTTILSTAGIALATYIKERRLVEDALRDSENNFKTLAQNTSALVWMTGRNNLRNYFNQVWLDFTGRTLNQEKGNGWLADVHPDDIQQCLNTYINGFDAHQEFTMEYRLRRKDGEFRWLLDHGVPRYNKQGFFIGFIGSCIDISERKTAEEKIHQLAFFDPLTGLPNRRLLLERIKHSIQVGRRESTQIALLMLDLDRFKAVNDTYGHQTGDELLQEVAARITNKLRDTDMVARLGGDEFIVLLDDITLSEDVARIAEAIIADLSKPFNLNQATNVLIGASIGISLFPQHGRVPEILMDNADTALYQAKNDGRGCFAYFSEELTLAARERMELETKLRLAVKQNALQVFYQPQVDVHSGRIIGAQALLRWQISSKEFIAPSRFIPIAEETGLIIEIGEWVLRQACQQARMWLENGLAPLTLSVKLTAHQLRHSDVNALVTRILKETGFPAAHLELELTEKTLIEHPESATVLQQLRAKGVRLGIDNFGSGYSSLSYLKRFPLDVLKVDKLLIDDESNLDITSTIVAMARTLNMKTLAKGIETSEQLSLLQTQGCDIYQGNFKSRPLPASEFSHLLFKQFQLS
ncbi:MAG: EAL domain-containing protein [Methylococcales bacterium]|nr:EAL domain-containing protein [Methylococcaceae bacterium]